MWKLREVLKMTCISDLGNWVDDDTVFWEIGIIVGLRWSW